MKSIPATLNDIRKLALEGGHDGRIAALATQCLEVLGHPLYCPVCDYPREFTQMVCHHCGHEFEDA